MYLFINHKCPNRLCLALVIIYCNIKKGNISTTTYVMDAYYSSKQSILEAVKPSMWVGGLMYIISNYVPSPPPPSNTICAKYKKNALTLINLITN